MANHVAAFWAPGTMVHFGCLKFVSTTDGMLVRIEQPAPCPLPVAPVATKVASLSRLEAVLAVPECRSERLWRHLDAILGVTPIKEDLHHILFAFHQA